MNSHLSEHLPLLASAPSGIHKLRGLILELAVRGKLVPQNPDDEPASELLKRITVEKTRLVAAGEVRKEKQLAALDENEKPFELPESWEWVRLPEIYFSISPSSNKLLSSEIQESGAIPVVDQGKRFVAGYTDDESLLIKIPGPVIIFGDHTTERKYIDFNFVAGADGVKILRPIFQYEKFFFHQINGYDLEERGYARHFKVLNERLYALPPLPEQHRIVAKVDELMALCDLLEEEQSDSASAHAKLVQTLLGTLTQSRDADELAAHWQRLSQHFDTLFSTESSLDALKQTILQLAVMGKLVKNMISALKDQELVQLIRNERQRGGYTDAGHDKKTFEDAKTHFVAPSTWGLLPLADLALVIVDCPHSTPQWTSSGKLCVRTSQFTAGRLDLAKPQFVSDETYFERIQRLKPLPDDILYSREGGILGIACRIPQYTELCLGQRMMLVRSPSQVVSAFLELVLNSPQINHYARERTTGGAAPRINVATVKAYPIPIPPLAEQHRIVAKVDELMTLCDRLKADLAEARTHQARLSSTLIDAALKAD